MSDGDPGRAHYERGLARLESYLLHRDDEALRGAIDSFRSATKLTPGDAACWAATGFALDAAGLEPEALEALRRAAHLDPRDHEVEVFVLTLLSSSGAEEEALAAVEAAAVRNGVDLESLRSELDRAGMPADSRTLITNGFIHARNFLRSRLEIEIERVRHGKDPGEAERRREAGWRECLDLQQELRRGLDLGRVPAEFRHLTSWAGRLGVGDDGCRRALAERLAGAERSELLRAVREHAPGIHAWLDGFGSGPMPAEPAAFLYLLLSIEEMDAVPDDRERGAR